MVRNMTSQAALYLLGFVAAAAPAWAQPSITGGVINTATVDVTIPPASPEVTLQLEGELTGVILRWVGPTGQRLQQQFSYAGPDGSVPFQAYAGGSPVAPPFNLYAQPGTWTLERVDACGIAGPCVVYKGNKLVKLFPTLTFQLANPNPPDITPPKMTAGIVLTPTVSLSQSPTMAFSISGTDALSGIVNMVVSADIDVNGSPDGFSVNASGTAPQQKATYTVQGNLPPWAPTGTYTVYDVALEDAAGNWRNVRNPAELLKLFHGTDTFDVTP